MPKYLNLDEFYSAQSFECAQAIRQFVAAVSNSHPDFELVLAWNQPMFRQDGKYVVGFMPTKNYVNLLTVSDYPVSTNAQLLAGFKHGGRSVSLPFDWAWDAKIIDTLIASRLHELGL